MPYKDPEKRRACSRESKRRSRAQEAKVAPLRTVKVYVCPKFPFLQVAPIPGAFFRDGFLITDQVEIQFRTESHVEFGRNIFPLALELTLTAPSMGDDG
jgi:hypothetical protein